MAKTTHDRPKGTPPRGEVVSAANADESTSNARADAPTAATWVHVSELRPNPKNPRLHGQEVLLLARTIVRTTWGAPILVQARTMRIIGGHGRLEAAKEILAGIEVDGFLRGGAGYQFRRDAPPECLPVCVLDVSDAEADAMTLADNAKRLQGRDDPAALVAMATASFERNAPTMIDLGLGADDLDALVKQAGDAVLNDAPGGDAPLDGDDAPRERIEVEEDEAPVDRAEELRAKWQTATGQLWEIPSATVEGGVHRILCGDSTSAAAVARLFDSAPKAKLLSTDPPYGVNFSGAKYNPRAKDWAPIQGDDRQGSDLRTWTANVWRAWLPFVEPDSAFYVWSPPLAEGFELHGSMRDVDIHVQSQIVWVKNCLVLGQADYQWKHEVCWYGFFKGQHHRWLGGRAQTTTWDVSRVRQADYMHPMQKPLDLYVIPMSNHTERGDICAEPFSGSGSQLVGAEQAGRLCFAMEIEPKYVAVALERLATLGLTPRLVS